MMTKYGNTIVFTINTRHFSFLADISTIIALANNSRCNVFQNSHSQAMHGLKTNKNNLQREETACSAGGKRYLGKGTNININISMVFIIYLPIE